MHSMKRGTDGDRHPYNEEMKQTKKETSFDSIKSKTLFSRQDPREMDRIGEIKWVNCSD